jgi:hypothetical protein
LASEHHDEHWSADESQPIGARKPRIVEEKQLFAAKMLCSAQDEGCTTDRTRSTARQKSGAAYRERRTHDKSF